MRKIVLAAPLETALGLRHDDSLVEPPGARAGERVTFSLWARADAGITRVELRAAPDGEEERFAASAVERRGALERWACTISPRVARFRYRFRIERDGGALHLSMRGLSAFDPVDAFDFTLLLGEPGPEWPLDAVLYQIFPDRFAAGNPAHRVRDGEWQIEGTPTQARRFGDAPLPWLEGKNADFYGGDLDGIRDRVGWLDELGVTCLFLNPVWPALSNHRYDLIDHGRVDPHLGGDAALGRLAEQLRAASMRLVLDVVLNHTGSAHPWFNREGLAGDGGAFRDAASPTRDFYLFDEWPHRYQSWLGHSHLPRLNLENAALRDAMYGPAGFLRKYLRPPFLVDGYRFDVANMMGRDGAAQGHRALWAELRGALRVEDPEAWLVGEHFFDPDKLLKGDGLDGVMAYHAFTFPLRAFVVGRDRHGAASLVDGRAFVTHLRESWARSGWPVWRRSTMHVNTHDLPRLQTVAGGLAGAGGRGALDLATTLQLGLPGVPCLYYGDEIGLEGGADPDNRRCMEWDEDKWDRQRLARTAGLIRMRRDSEALRRGGLVDLGSDGDTIAVARVLGEEIKLVVASRAPDPVEIELDLRGLGRASQRVALGPMSATIVDAG